MGCASSKIQHEDAVVGQCEQRKSFVKQAVAARANLASAHARYVQALSSTSLAFRHFIEAEFPDGPPASSAASSASSSSASAPPPGVSTDTSSNDSPASSSEIIRNTSTMRLWNTPTEPVTVVLSPPRRSPPEDYYIDIGGVRGGGNGGAAGSPPPPPHGSNDWEYFDIFHPPPPSVRRYRENVESEEDIPALESSDDEPVKSKVEPKMKEKEIVVEEVKPEEDAASSSSAVSSSLEEIEKAANAGVEAGDIQPESGKEKNESGDTEPEVKAAPAPAPAPAPIEMADVLREVEEQFLRAAEAGKPVLRMLEARRVHNQLERGFSDHSSRLLSALSLGHWSPRSLSSPTEGLDSEGSGGMSGSHAATLDRLYAWEKKLYEEVKAWESINSELDRKRKFLRNLDARGAKPDVIDKTRASMKALETEISVAVHAMEASSTEIQRITDEEMLPQLLELLEGLAVMWRSMHECHEQQLSVVMQLKLPDKVAVEASSTSHKNSIVQLDAALTAWHTSLNHFIVSQKDYVRSLTGWIKQSVLPDHQNSRRKKAPPPKIQYMCDRWTAALERLTLLDVTSKIRELADTLREIGGRQAEELRIQRRVDAVAKELDKKVLSLKNMEKKFMESRDTQDVSFQFAEKRSSVEALRRKVEEEKQKLNRAVHETRAFTLRGLQMSLPPLFLALESFTGTCMSIHQELFTDVNSYIM